MAKKVTIPSLFAEMQPVTFEEHTAQHMRDVLYPVQVIYGIPPSKSNCYRIIQFKSKATGANHASLAKTQKLRKYENDFIKQCMKYRNRNIDGNFEIEVDVYYPNNRSDLDNSLKCLLDCLQHRDVSAIKNDNRCMSILTNKHIDKDNPRIEFIIGTDLASRRHNQIIDSVLIEIQNQIPSAIQDMFNREVLPHIQKLKK